MSQKNQEQLSLSEVEHIAQLARIELSEKEKDKFRKELSAILGYVAQLKEVNTDNIEPIDQITNLRNIVRHDKSVRPDNQLRQNLLKLAPKTKKNYLKVKSVF